MCKSKAFVLLACIFFYFTISSLGQNNFADSLRQVIRNPKNDSVKLDAMLALEGRFRWAKNDTSILLLMQSINLAERSNNQYGKWRAYTALAFVLGRMTSNYPKSLELAQKSLTVAEGLKVGREKAMAESYMIMGGMNVLIGYDSIGFAHSRHAIQLYDAAGIPDSNRNFGPYFNLSRIYLNWKKFDSAVFYANRNLEVTLSHFPQGQDLLSVNTSNIGLIYQASGDMSKAQNYFWRALEYDRNVNAPFLRSQLYNQYSGFLIAIGKPDSSVYFAQLALAITRKGIYGQVSAEAAGLLSKGYQRLGKADSALKYARLVLAIKDTIFNNLKLQQFQLLNFDEEQRQRDILAAQEKYRGQVKFYGMTAAVIIFLVISLILYRNNRSKQKANGVLESQKTEIGLQRTKAESALEELRSTQAQLIQSEKMASLGELTAGIAHEIQNPLNFVNNFSEVNRELLQEMQQEIQKGNIKEVATISQAIIDNEEKINQHGKRADSIVKGMLQHSRTNAGEKTLTDLNALVDEYLRLSYHGFRARDSNFNVRIESVLDPSIGKVNVMAQDLGRVLLNLFNNAFFAVREKQNGSVNGYVPIVSVVTRMKNNKFEIKVRDNGVGIPEKIKDKIFQPFFTTKPAGQGTGLGLSLCYDMVKAQGGEIKLSNEGNSETEFIVELPT